MAKAADLNIVREYNELTIVKIEDGVNDVYCVVWLSRSNDTVYGAGLDRAWAKGISEASVLKVASKLYEDEADKRFDKLVFLAPPIVKKD